MIKITFTGPTVEIGVQPNVLPFSYECSGSVARGQGVVVCGDMQVKQPGTAIAAHKFASGCVGVAEYAQTDGNWIAVYGPGAIVRIIISGTGKCGHGDMLACTTEGKWAEIPAANPSGVQAIALDDQNTANGTARALLV